MTAPLVTDSVDELVEAWREARPGIDPSHLHLFGRIPRIEAQLRRRAEAWLAPLGLSWDMFDLMATLLRAPDHTMRPGELSRWCLLSTGAMTKRLDRLERAGFVTRATDPADRRALLVRLTPEGLALAERAVPVHFAAAQAALAALSPEERRAMEALSRRLLTALEAETVPA